MKTTVLFCAILCYSVLFCAILCTSVLFCVLLCISVLFWVFLCCSELKFTAYFADHHFTSQQHHQIYYINITVSVRITNWKLIAYISRKLNPSYSHIQLQSKHLFHILNFKNNYFIEFNSIHRISVNILNHFHIRCCKLIY